MREPQLLASSFNRPNISYSVAYCDVVEQQQRQAGGQEAKYALLLEAIKQAGRSAGRAAAAATPATVHSFIMSACPQC